MKYKLNNREKVKVLKVAIVGAGAAGLAAAYELGKHGHQAIVYEQAPFIGGQASTFDVGGERLERGYHHWFTNDTDIITLVKEIGLGHQIRWIDSTVGTFHDGKIYNFVTPLDLLKFTPLSLMNRVRLGLVTLYLQKRSNWRSLEKITASKWLRKYAGRQAYDNFWGPMLRGKFGDEYYNQVTLAWIWSKIQTRVASRGKGMIKEKLGYPIGSFGEVFDVLVKLIEENNGAVHLKSAVKRIIVENDNFVGLEVSPIDREPIIESFDAVIATTPSYIFPNLVPTLPKDYLAKLNNVDYLAAVLIVLVLDRPLSHVYWLNVADDSIPFVAVIEHTNLINADHYGGKSIVYLSNYLTPDSPLYNFTQEELIREYLPHLRKINIDFDESWILTSYHHKVRAAQPVIPVNYSAKIPDHRTPFRGIYLANTTQIYPEDRGTNYSVKMGRQVAEMVIGDYSSRS